MGLPERKLGELDKKLESLTNEFVYWRDQSEAFKPLEKHHSQIRRVTLQLEGLQLGIRKELKAIGKKGNILSRVRKLELDILEVHRIWEFFRSKFVLRSVKWFAPYLMAADDLAAFTYIAAQDKFNYAAIPEEDLKAPPLVFFNGGSSPYTQPRSVGYAAEAVADEELRNVQSWEVLQSLPIPVIGIPWFQIQHLPDILVIGHEVGHDVEEDFRLTDTISDLLEQAMDKAHMDNDHREAWSSWIRESFADIYGNLSAGPAFVESLLDFLATDRTSMAKDQRKAPHWGIYPPDYLRIQLNLEVLEQQGFKPEATTLRKELKTTYGDHAMKEFKRDLEHIVDALISGTYPQFNNKSLRDVAKFDRSDHDNALTVRDQLLHGNAPTQTDIRTLLAGARLAYTKNPQKYKVKNAHKLILDAVPASRPDGVRAGAERKRTPEQAQAADDADRNAGERLFEILRGNAKARTNR